MMLQNVIAATVACLLMTAAASPATGATLDEAMAAVRAKDCGRLGAVVNAGIDKRAVPLLYLAGLMFDEGLCVDPDAKRARNFYDNAARSGDRATAIALGLHYALADGLPRSYARAGTWLMHAYALEVRDLERSAASQVAIDRRDALREIPGLDRYMTMLPPMPPNNDAVAEWAGYLTSVHFLAARTMRFPRVSLEAGMDASYAVRVCPQSDKVEIARTRMPRSESGGVDASRAERALRDEIERAYREAQRLLPRPQALPGEAKCLRAPVAFRTV